MHRHAHIGRGERMGKECSRNNRSKDHGTKFTPYLSVYKYLVPINIGNVKLLKVLKEKYYRAGMFSGKPVVKFFI